MKEIDQLKEVVFDMPISGMFGDGPCVEFAVSRDDDGNIHAVDKVGSMVVTVIPDSARPCGAKIVHRRRIQPILNKRVSVLLAELNGVKVYIRENSIIVTTEKMQP